MVLAGAVFAGVTTSSVSGLQSPVQSRGPATGDGRPQTADPRLDAAREQQLLQQFCYACHSERARAAGLDSAGKLAFDTLDTADVHRYPKTWELVARKLRAGMMPPPVMGRPDPATYYSMSAWLASELDRKA